MDSEQRRDSGVGEAIRSLRIKQKISLRELSVSSTLSVHAISKIEHGENSPTVASLHKLASALNVPITEFFRQETYPFAVFVKPQDCTLIKSKGIVIESLGSGLPDQKLEPFKMIVAPGSTNSSEPASHSGEEFVYCLSGRLEYFVGNQAFILEPGDKLLFKANQPHHWRNLENEPAEVLLVFETSHEKLYAHRIN
jgi:transcriptional regulator with XRE-family HTH domain